MIKITTLLRRFPIKFKICGKHCGKPVENSKTCGKPVENSVENLWISIRAGVYNPYDGE